VLITVDAARRSADAHAQPERLGGLPFERAYAQAPSTTFPSPRCHRHAPDQPGARTLAEILRERLAHQAFYPARLFFDGRRRWRYARTRFGFEWTDTRTLPPRAHRRGAAPGPIRRAAHVFVGAPDTHEPSRRQLRSAVAAVDRELGRLFALRASPVICA
jgi:hypothetical protein